MKKRKEKNHEYDPDKLLWAVVVTNVILIVVFLVFVAVISCYFGPINF